MNTHADQHETQEPPDPWADAGFFDPLNHTWSSLQSPVPPEAHVFGSSRHDTGLDAILMERSGYADLISVHEEDVPLAEAQIAEQIIDRELERQGIMQWQIDTRVTDGYHHGVRPIEDLRRELGDRQVASAEYMAELVTERLGDELPDLRDRFDVLIAHQARALAMQRSPRYGGELSLRALLVDASLIARSLTGDARLVQAAALTAMSRLLSQAHNAQRALAS